MMNDMQNTVEVDAYRVSNNFYCALFEVIYCIVEVLSAMSAIFGGKMSAFSICWMLSLILALSSGAAAQQWWLGAYKHVGKVAFQPDANYKAFRNVLDYGCDSK